MAKPPRQYRHRVTTHEADGPSPQDLAARLAELEAMRLLDNRTPAEQWLNDPPRWRSALASRKPA